MYKRTLLTTTAIALSIAAFGVGCSGSSETAGRKAEPEGWGQGNLTEAEKRYYMARIVRTISTWQEMGHAAPRARDGRIEEPFPALLVIDTTKAALWVEKDRKVLDSTRADLPETMKWRILHATPKGNQPLPPVVRLRIRGFHTDRLTPERIHLVGERGGGEHLSFEINSHAHGSDYGSGPFQPQTQWKERKTDKEPYGSILLSDAEYEEYPRAAADADSTVLDDDGQTGRPTPPATNLSNWRKVEKWLYAGIEKQVWEKGFNLRSVEIEPGPDYTAGHAEIRSRNDGPFRRMVGGSSSGQAYLKIDFLGDDVWYVKSAPHPQHPMPARFLLDLEFLVHATRELPQSEQIKWLAAGRKKQQPAPRTPSPWQATLPNGTTVEFIGICENPSGGKPWWGPDGSPLQDAPYFNAYTVFANRAGRNAFEIVWRIVRPSRQGGSGMRSSLEGCVGSGFREIRDRYGMRIYDLHAEAYLFPKLRETTTLDLAVNVANGPYQRVLFKNVSLVPGTNAGFEIAVEK